MDDRHKDRHDYKHGMDRTSMDNPEVIGKTPRRLAPSFVLQRMGLPFYTDVLTRQSIDRLEIAERGVKGAVKRRGRTMPYTNN